MTRALLALPKSQFPYKLSVIFCVNSVVVRVPPMSTVLFPSESVLNSAFSIFLAYSNSLIYFNISIADNNHAAGFALFCPFISGAEP